MLKELKQLTIDYAKQETLSPLKGIGIFLAKGAAGSLCLGIGLVLCALGVLRLLQTETGPHLTNHLSWIPYVVAFIAGLIVVGLAVLAIKKDSRAAKRRQAEQHGPEVMS
jgi:hypothetical protein